MTSHEKLLVMALFGLIASLLLIGAVSSTFLRHVVQLVPAYLLLYGAYTGRAWTRSGAVAVFLFWLLIVAGIWAFLLGISHILSGTFSTTERVLTGTMAVSSICGMAAVVGDRRAAGWPARVAGFLLLAALQFGAMWLSLQPAIAHR